jgi:pimeloyl-ACP methyl ester carboxylesterase
MPTLRHAFLAIAALLPLAACGGGGGGTTVAADGTPVPSPKGDIVLANMGSYHVGGRAVTIVGKPVRDVQFTPGGPVARIDPNGTFLVEHMYAQWFEPRWKRGAAPLVLMHGGGMTGVQYETTPDGRDGWLNFFLRRGWSVHNADAVERGRAGWARYPDIFRGEPVFLAQPEAFERFRIGDGAGSFAKREMLEGNQFPAEAYDQLVRQMVPRWTSTDEAITEAYIALVDRTCPCVLVAHSQAGQFAFRAAEARPDKVRAIVAIEPTGFGDPGRAAEIKGVPVLAIYGDYIEQDTRWPAIKGNGLRYFEVLRAAGATVDVLDLPRGGIAGNSHMPMMDKNSDQVAERIQDWLMRRNLWR